MSAVTVTIARMALTSANRRLSTRHLTGFPCATGYSASSTSGANGSPRCGMCSRIWSNPLRSTRDRDFGYGQVYREPRADKDYHFDAPSMSERMRESQGGRTERKADDVRLTRYVVTETKNVEVPVSREEVRVERD